MASGWGETGAEGEWDNCMRRILEKTKTGDGMGTKWRGWPWAIHFSVWNRRQGHQPRTDRGVEIWREKTWNGHPSSQENATTRMCSASSVECSREIWSCQVSPGSTTLRVSREWLSSVLTPSPSDSIESSYGLSCSIFPVCDHTIRTCQARLCFSSCALEAAVERWRVRCRHSCLQLLLWPFALNSVPALNLTKVQWGDYHCHPIVYGSAQLKAPSRVADRFWAACCRVLLPWISLTMLTDQWSPQVPYATALDPSPSPLRARAHTAESSPKWLYLGRHCPGHSSPSLSANPATSPMTWRLQPPHGDQRTTLLSFNISLPFHPYSLPSPLEAARCDGRNYCLMGLSHRVALEDFLCLSCSQFPLW